MIVIKTNLNSSSHSNIWEAFKPYMRGHFMSHVAHKNKVRREALSQLEKDILKHDHSLTNNQILEVDSN